MRLFCEKKGAISVFLSLILLPMLIVALLANDAARIYCAKSVIADAGEMTMNAALSKYNDKLKDEYGLIAMDKQPSSMQKELEGYFTDSLNSSGLSNAGDYKHILDLVEQSFEVIDVEASKVYKTEVEKQQILEYMKYRAPVCMAEMVMDKLDQIKDNKKMMEAMEAQADFAEAMEECQDAFQNAKEKLEDLSERVEMFPSDTDVNALLDRTYQEYTTTMSKALLMKAALSCYGSYDQQGIRNATDTQAKFDLMKNAMNSFLTMASKVDLNQPLSDTTYDNYIDAMYYKNTIDYMGKIDDLLTWYDELNTSSGEEETEDSADSAEDEERKKLSDKITEYKNKNAAIAPAYRDILTNTAKDIVSRYSEQLNNIRSSAGDGMISAADAYEALQKVEKKLKEAQEKHKIWKEKTAALSDPGSMQDEVEKYEGLFGTDSCDRLMEKVANDRDQYKKVKSQLEGEKFYDQSIAVVSSEKQLQKYNSEANYAMNGRDDYHYTGMDFVRSQTYITGYQHISVSYSLSSIKDDAFYAELIRYCQDNESAEKEKQKKEANEKLEQGAQGAEEAKKEDDELSFDWSSVEMSLPSDPNLLGYSSYRADTSALTDTAGGNIGSKKDRKNIIKKVKESIKQANSFLDGLDRILSDGVENLYIAEYAMQMFTYYTVDKQVNASHTIDTLSGENLTSLSGYLLTADKHKAYKAETEYILWGKSSSKQNVQATVAVIYGIRLLFNTFFALTNHSINEKAELIAAPWSGTPYMVPIIKLVFKFGMALCETTDDIKDIKAGYGVSVTKSKTTWVSGFAGGMGNEDNTRGTFTLDYAEYLRLFLNTSMLVSGYEPALARIGDCIQVNTGDSIDITKMSTMVSIQATVTNRTTYMRKIADWSGAGWSYGDRYSIDYKSVLGY